VVAAKNAIVPRAIDTGICCGMRMVRSDIDVRSLTAPVLDALFGELMATIPVLWHEQDAISKDDVAGILVHGGEWSRKKFGLSDDEMNCIEDRGTMPTDTDDAEAILASVPDKAMKKGRRCFGTLGDGNHFLELQEIVEVLEPEIARLLGLSVGKALFMLHTGSRSVGSKTTKAYLEELEEKFLPTQNGSALVAPIWSMPADSEEGVKLARAISAASNFGFANRIAITEKLRAAVRKTLHDDSLLLPLLYDCAHVSIKPEKWNGEKLWVHRHGGSRALPASLFAEHPIFSKTGQPVPIPGSMGHDSFIGVADARAVETFCSVNHGAGRVMDKPEAQTQFTETQVEKEMRDKNIRLYRYGADNIAEQAPSSFKDISQVIRAMSALSLVKPVVRLRPVAVLKG
jgi:tRNA-splicing ligase RtcB